MEVCRTIHSLLGQHVESEALSKILALECVHRRVSFDDAGPRGPDSQRNWRIITCAASDRLTIPTPYPMSTSNNAPSTVEGCRRRREIRS